MAVILSLVGLGILLFMVVWCVCAAGGDADKQADKMLKGLKR